MPRFGRCSVCKVQHSAPFGTRCKFMHDAKKLCVHNNLPEISVIINFENMSTEFAEVITDWNWSYKWHRCYGANVRGF